MTEQQEGQRELAGGEPPVNLKLSHDDLILTHVQLSASVAVISACARGEFPPFEGIDAIDLNDLLAFHLRVKQSLNAIGSKKFIGVDVNGRAMSAYGRSIPILEVAGDYIESVGGQAGLSKEEGRKIAVGAYKKVNDAFVAAGGINNLKLLNELNQWAGVI